MKISLIGLTKPGSKKYSKSRKPDKKITFHHMGFFLDSGDPHDGRVGKNPYPHDRRADKDSYSHDSNIQCIILRLQLSFMMINVQLMLV